MVFYAGHGIEVDKRNFLIPVDARLVGDGDVEFETVPLDLLSRAVERAKGLRLIVLDACRDNPFAVAMQRSGATRSIGRGLGRVEPSGETLVAYAAKEGTVASDGEGRNSPYTTALLAHLEEPGLEVGLMFRKVRDAVLASTGGRQEPFVYGSLSSEGAYLAARPEPKEPKQVVTDGPEDPKPAPVAPGNDRRLTAEELAAERVFWESVKDSEHAADFEAYLEQFPGGTYEALARNRLARLTGKQDEKPDVQVVVVTPDEPERVASPEPPVPTPESIETALDLNRDERRRIQQGLASLGFGPGPADGLFGQSTRKAIASWQSTLGDAVTGHLDAEAAKALLAAGEEAALKRETMRPGWAFRDCPECPEMVVVPAGSFMMGSPASEEGRWDDEGPVHRVTISELFAVGKYEVTRGEFGQFMDATGHSTATDCKTYENGEFKRRSGLGWQNPGYRQDERHPVVCVSWDDAKAYVAWLSQKTEERYRLLSEAEWEYAARAGTRTSRYWGDDASAQCMHANGYDQTAKPKLNLDLDNASCRDGWIHTARVGGYSANGFGLLDVLGNVWEWVEDCWHESYAGAPRGGSAWMSGGECRVRVIRGGSWAYIPRNLRSANRNWDFSEDRYYDLGFRIARTLTP